MKNPCDECLIKPCCSDRCDKKHSYTEFLSNELQDIYKLMYNDGPNKEVRQRYLKIRKLCDRNTNENNIIFERYLEVGINKK
jgi:uncharacterized protein (UPF0335 family)